MADQRVTYEVRLKDMMSARLKGMGARVKALAAGLRGGLAKGLAAAAKGLRAVKTAAIAGGLALAGMTYVALRLGKSFLEAASIAEDTYAKFSVVFRGIESEATEMAQGVAEDMGYGLRSIQGFMSELGDTFVPMGFARKEAATMATALSSLAGDLASFNPGIRDAAEATEILQSVMVGMHRPALRFGVVINENTIKAKALELGMGGVTGELTDQEKVLIRMQLVLEGTSDAQGDAIRTADSYKNSLRAMSEGVTDLREEMGEGLKVAIEEAVQRFGGAERVLEFVRLAFEVITNFLIDSVIPAVENVMTAFMNFNDALGGVGETSSLVGDAMKFMFRIITIGLLAIATPVLLFIVGLQSIKLGVELLGTVLVALGLYLAEGFVRAFGLALGVLKLFFDALDGLAQFIVNTVMKAFRGLVSGVADLVEGIGVALDAITDWKIIPDMVKGAGDAARDAAAEMRGFASSVDVDFGPTMFASLSVEIAAFQADAYGAAEAIREFNDSFQAAAGEDLAASFASMRATADLAMLSISKLSSETGIAASEFESIRDRVLEAKEALKDVVVSTPEERDMVAAMAAQMERLAAAMALVKSKADEAKGGVGELTDEGTQGAKVYEGWSGGLEMIQDQMGTWGEQMADITVSGLQQFAAGMTNALVSIIDGSKSAGEAFRDFASQFLVQIGTMILQALVFRAIRGAVGIPFADGGIAQGLGEMHPLAMGGTVSGGVGRLMPVKGYATGGPIVDSPHVALIGEGQHNEAVVPLPDGRSIPVEMRGGAGANVTVQIDAVDAASVDKLFTERRETLVGLIEQAIGQSRSFRGAVGRA
jgi:methyl-accepting chemotaxis protein